MSEGFRAVETLYHDYLTGLILTAVTRRSPADAADLVFRVFRHQHHEKFLPGLAKLGLDRLPHAVACARYHYLSNHLGGVRVEYMEESERKAWVRYVPPRWIWPGPTICAVPSEVTRAMLRGWHAHNGVTLGNPRLGFVCTGMTTDGRPGLEGYYLEGDRPLAPDERLRFAPDEEAPPFDPARAPRLDSATWPPERLRKAARNYTMEYVRSALVQSTPEEARALGAVTGRLVGMQDYAETAACLSVSGDGPDDFAEYLCRIGRAQGDQVAWEKVDGEIAVRQTSWRLMRGVADGLDPARFEAWNAIWEGALSVHNRRLELAVTSLRLDGTPAFEWRVRPRRRQRA
ncbi:MAG TPA: hypothetical protein VGT02_15740 [Methylomirabilota bacterium]|jgi:hypothetical protein|nr:hypothetical protein [Methylomirabilota bacterium]